MSQTRLLPLVLAFLFSTIATQAQRTYAPHSVLATGNWHRLAILKDGVYKLDRAYLQSLGLNLAEIDPRTIRVYGDGGGALPQANAAPRHDDLPETAIQVVGEADGVFNEGDYVLFFANGAHRWDLSAGKWNARHVLHPYTDTTFYYLTFGGTNGKRIATATPAANTTAQTTLVRGVFYEKELDSPIKSGRIWLGELFDFYLSRTVSVHVPGASAGDSLTVRIRLAAASEKNGSTFSITINGQVVKVISFDSADIYGDTYAYRDEEVLLKLPITGSLTGDSLRVKLDYNKAGSSLAKGWLDWVEVLYEANTANLPSQHDLMTLAGQPATLALPANASAWDVTDPVHVAQVAVNNGSIMVGDDNPRRIWIHNGGYFTPAAATPVANQDLHGLASNYDLVIVTAPVFWEQAERLAQLHRDSYQQKVLVVTPRQIYQEFGSGEQDATAIRDFMKMFYDRNNFVAAPQLLLMGDGTYDPRDVLAANRGRNFILTYAARQSAYRPGAFTCDDFFTLLDEDEGQWGESAGVYGDANIQTDQMDTGVGRLPVNSPSEANAMVDKIIAYVTSPQSMGSWRNRLLLVADHKDSDGNIHASQADNLSNILKTEAPCVNVDKLYMDNYPMVSSAGDYTFPAGKSALLDAIDEGALVVNYTGHGGEQTWSQGKILTNTDIDQLNNAGKMPLFVTATCEFGRYDDPSRTSGAELLTIRAGGGAIGAITSVRLVYSDANANFNKLLYNELFDYDAASGRMPLLGEIYARAKNNMYKSSSFSNINTRNFALLGDPAIPLAYATLQTRITAINDNPVDNTTDSLPSLAKVTVTGQVTDRSGQLASHFNGPLEAIVFDKPGQYTTSRRPLVFYWQNSRLFSGTDSVRNGQFTTTFVVPLDVSYTGGTGKISLYATSDTIDAGGCYQNIYFGGTDTLATPDTTPPLVEVMINDSFWVDGSITNPEPAIYARLSDASGINTVRSSIGHELKATFSTSATELILNDQFHYTPESYTEGTLRYRLRDYTSGTHTITLQAWDNANNVGTASTTFTISDNNQLALAEILAFPNPMQGKTTFRIGSNRAERPLRVDVDIFTPTGAQIRHLSGEYTPTGTILEPLTWNGDTDTGAEVPKGIYLYRVTLTDIESGETASEFQRIVVLR